jgi:hypothetical protein
MPNTLFSHGTEALAKGAWEEARDAFQAALAKSHSPEALEGFATATWFLNDVASVFEAREEAYRLYRERGDRATFPSDTVSTHVVHPPGIAALGRWRLLDRLTATGCPLIHTYAYDFGDVVIAGAPGTAESPVAYCPRRTALDKLLVEAA